MPASKRARDESTTRSRKKHSKSDSRPAVSGEPTSKALKQADGNRKLAEDTPAFIDPRVGKSVGADGGEFKKETTGARGALEHNKKVKKGASSPSSVLLKTHDDVREDAKESTLPSKVASSMPKVVVQKERESQPTPPFVASASTTTVQASASPVFVGVDGKSSSVAESATSGVLTFATSAQTDVKHKAGRKAFKLSAEVATTLRGLTVVKSEWLLGRAGVKVHWTRPGLQLPVDVDQQKTETGAAPAVRDEPEVLSTSQELVAEIMPTAVKSSGPEVDVVMTADVMKDVAVALALEQEPVVEDEYATSEPGLSAVIDGQAPLFKVEMDELASVASDLYDVFTPHSASPARSWDGVKNDADALLRNVQDDSLDDGEKVLRVCVAVEAILDGVEAIRTELGGQSE